MSTPSQFIVNVRTVSVFILKLYEYVAMLYMSRYITIINLYKKLIKMAKMETHCADPYKDNIQILINLNGHRRQRCCSFCISIPLLIGIVMLVVASRREGCALLL